MPILALIALLGPEHADHGTGLEWMPIASFLIPFVFLVVVIWLSTALLQVPQHGRLQRGFEARAQQALVNGNWIRTAAWSLRAILVSWLMIR